MSWRSQRIQHQVPRIKGNNADPDDANSWLCIACTLPIFLTPYISNTDDQGTRFFLHDQCANLPKELKDCELHPQRPLLLRENVKYRITCNQCNRNCGTKFYYCPDPDCDLKLDLLCALTIKILHRSHKHSLMVFHGERSGTCNACGTKHHGPLWGPSYLCNVCIFWIHPDCASLPNAIEHRHEHPLVLNYNFKDRYGRAFLIGRCAICGGKISSAGIYSCIKCPDYHVHIMCAVSEPQSFKSVLIREARLPGLVRLPIPNECKSLVHYVTDGASSSTTDEHDGDELQTDLHEHPLIFHDHDDGDIIINYDDPRVCNACVKFISPPFYICSECPKFFLHSCCAHLPRSITRLLAYPGHPLLYLIPNKSIINEFSCSFCPEIISNGFFYSTTSNSVFLHLLCALIPESITHDAHGKTHILYLLYISRYSDHPTDIRGCNCCGRSLERFVYDCWTCRDFILHASCALLPDTVGHKFDKHPLKLITSCSDHDKQEFMFCEVCEGIINKKLWYYSCSECEQSFHIKCIPCLDHLSMIKFGHTIQVECHSCPLVLIRGLTLRGYRCDCCGRTFKDDDNVAFECSKCCFWIDLECAEKNFRPSSREQVLWWRRPIATWWL